MSRPGGSRASRMRRHQQRRQCLWAALPPLYSVVQCWLWIVCVYNGWPRVFLV